MSSMFFVILDWTVYMFLEILMLIFSKIFNSQGFSIVMGKNAKHLSFYLCWNHSSSKRFLLIDVNWKVWIEDTFSHVKNMRNVFQ